MKAVFCGIYFAVQHSLPDVKKEASDIILKNVETILNGPEFLDLENKQFEYLFLLVKPHVIMNQVLETTVKWTMHDVSTRKVVFERMIKNTDIELTDCTSDVVLAVYEKYAEVLITDLNVEQKFTTAVVTLANEEPSDILIIGGYACKRKERVFNRKTWVLNLKTGACSEKAGFPRFYGAICDSPVGAISAGGSMLRHLDGSYTRVPTAAIQVAELYDKHTDSWGLLPPPPAPLGRAGAVCVQDAMLMVVCGGKGEDRKTKVYGYDLSKRNWRTLPDMLQGMSDPVVGCIKNCVYVISPVHSEHEFEKRGCQIPVQCFDTLTSKWSFKAPLPRGVTRIAGACAVALAGMLYVVGQELCLRYNPSENTWTVLEQPVESHTCCAAMVLNNKIIICGGTKGSTFCPYYETWSYISPKNMSDTIEEYDPSTNTWRRLPVKLPMKLESHFVVHG